MNPAAHQISQMQWPRLKSLKPTFADIRTAVTDNAKQRFSMKPNPSLPEPPSPSSENPADWMIRANQGHSIAIDSAALLIPITLEAGNVPETCVHGTYFAFYGEILKSGGLKKMGRNHVHFGTGIPEDGGVVSGMRGDAEVLIFVDVKRCLEEEPEMKWWVSENGVVLTEGDGEGVVGTRFWKRVEGRREGGVLWKDGVKVAELEEGLRIYSYTTTRLIHTQPLTLIQKVKVSSNFQTYSLHHLIVFRTIHLSFLSKNIMYIHNHMQYQHNYLSHSFILIQTIHLSSNFEKN